MENLNDIKDINRGWENIKENISTSAKDRLSLRELKQHKPGFLDQRKQAKVQWLQEPNQNNVDNLNNVIWAASRHFRKQKEGISES